jgi:hypothetical protein
MKPLDRFAGYIGLRAVVTGCIERNDRKIIGAGRKASDDI